MTSAVSSLLPVGLRMAPTVCMYLRGKAFVLCYSTRTLQGADARLSFHLRSSLQFCTQDLTGSGRGTVPHPPPQSPQTAGLFPSYRLLIVLLGAGTRTHAHAHAHTHVVQNMTKYAAVAYTSVQSVGT